MLARLGRYLAREGGELVTAAGDDAAVWQPPLGRAVVTTTDSLVEGVHFSLPLSVTGAVDLGWRLLAVSLSDIAAMGAVPGPAFIAISVPGAWPVAWVEGIYQGIAECAAGFDVPVAGGNISASPAAVLTSTCLGSVDSQHHLLRNGAAAGDQLAVTGPLGAAAATLRADALTGEGPGQWAAAARPSPRVEAGQVLVACGVHQALDISDGLFVDTGRLLQLADCPGLLIDAAQVPAAPGVRERWPREWLGVVGGGEDYELAFAAPPAVMQRAMRALGAAGLAPAIIGRFDHGEGLRVMLDGEEVPPPESGHQHFQA